MKKFTSVSLARTKKSITSALMGLAILFVTLNFVSATLSTKVYSSNTNISYGAGIPNNGTKDDAFPFWGTGLQDNEPAPRIMFEDDNFPPLTTSLQNNDAEEKQNLSLSTVDCPASTDELFRRDLKFLDSEDSLYGHYSFHRLNLTKTLSEKRFDDPGDQKRYKNALDYYEAKKSEHELLKDYTSKNDPNNFDYLDDLRQETFKKFNDSQAGTAAFNGDPFENENIILTYDNKGSEDNFPNVLNFSSTASHPSSLPVPIRASDTVALFPYDIKSSSSYDFYNDDSSYNSEESPFHRDGTPNLLAQAQNISPSPSRPW